jgi:diguanylate cyclase (GGDEF)-like protein
MSKILLLEKNKELTESLEGIFATDQTEIIIALDAKSIVKRANEDNPDLILLDTEPSVEDAYKACKKIKDRRKTKNIPVIFLVSEKNDSDILSKCLEIGGTDYLQKPLDARKMLTKVQTVIKRAHVLNKLSIKETEEIVIRDELSQEIESLHQINRNVEETALIDRLTGLYDKSYFFSKLKEEFQHAQKFKTPISIIILDVDSFGRVNDTYGHDVGDYVLMKMANVILTNSRAADIVGRLEGANFAVILPGVDMQSGIFEAERLRIAISQKEYVDNSKIERKGVRSKRKKMEKTITVSIGIATSPFIEPVKNEIEFFAFAKRALDRAKTTGKNKTISANDLLTEN